MAVYKQLKARNIMNNEYLTVSDLYDSFDSANKTKFWFLNIYDDGKTELREPIADGDDISPALVEMINEI